MKRFRNWVGEMFSEAGTPSSSRVLTFILSLGCLGIITGIFVHIWTTSPQTQEPWLAQMPWIIGSLTGFAVSPYAINKGGSTLSDLFKGSKVKDKSAK
jgi:hypothetical protein